jgi:hypothetical protein
LAFHAQFLAKRICSAVKISFTAATAIALWYDSWVWEQRGHGRGLAPSSFSIAEQLHLSSKTVDVHRSHIKEKLELKDATALIRHAVRWVKTQKTGQ